MQHPALLLRVVLGLLLPAAGNYSLAAAIDPADPYAWSENAGWMNHRDLLGSVEVYADHFGGLGLDGEPRVGQARLLQRWRHAQLRQQYPERVRRDPGGRRQPLWLRGIGATDLDRDGLLALLRTWDSETADYLQGADRATLLQALRDYLAPDGDGEVIVFR